MKIFTISAILLTLLHCDKVKNLSCDERFFDCASVCSSICERTIAHGHEYGKCFTICTYPCRKEYCKDSIKEKE
jgi:hypothetical protein